MDEVQPIEDEVEPTRIEVEPTRIEVRAIEDEVRPQMEEEVPRYLASEGPETLQVPETSRHLRRFTALRSVVLHGLRPFRFRILGVVDQADDAGLGRHGDRCLLLGEAGAHHPPERSTRGREDVALQILDSDRVRDLVDGAEEGLEHGVVERDVFFPRERPAAPNEDPLEGLDEEQGPERVGPTAEVTRAIVRPGDTIRLVGEVVLLCTLRLPAFPALTHARVAHPFGDPDASEIVGEGPEAWRVRDEATRLGRGTDFALILGETGTGKTAVAELIHKESSRARGPFVHRNSVNFTTTLLESRLFGKITNFPSPGPAGEGVLAALESTKGNLTHAARNMGIQRNKLHRIMKALGIMSAEE